MPDSPTTEAPRAEPPRKAARSPNRPPRRDGEQIAPADSRVDDAAPRVTVLYHFLQPDDVVSGRLLDDLCQGLVERGWVVEALPCNRGCHDARSRYARDEVLNGVRMRRVWRPPLRQASTAGRLLNALWMIAAWSAAAVRRRAHRPDVLIVGTDPPLSVIVALVWKRLCPRTRIVHWVHDVFPDAAVAEGYLGARSALTGALRRLLARAYSRCDLIADLGPCMRARLEADSPAVRHVTLPPWALVEPAAPPAPDPALRTELFGGARLGLLYSGNFGRAHAYEPLLALARRLRGEDIRFVFAVRGNSVGLLRQAVTADDVNVGFADFACEAELESRLAAADIHLVSLREEWTGIVVPSKFVGALAVGRPVLFAGSPASAVAGWIERYRLGWVLDDARLDEVAAALRALTRDPAPLEALKQRCFETYRAQFARAPLIDRWAALLDGLRCSGAGRLPEADAA